MDAYGLSSELSHGNFVNADIRQRNAEIDRNNTHLQQQYNIALKNLPTKKKSEQKVASIMEGIGGGSIVKGVLGGTRNVLQTREAIGKVGEPIRKARRVQFLQSSAGAEEAEPRLLQDATAVENVGADTIGSDVSKLSKGLDAFGKASDALNIGLGAYDAFEDFKAGKVEGKNINEKIANVSQISSGGADALGVLSKPVGMAVDYGAEALGFEEAGAALDATGVGAAVGLGLNAIGAGIGIFGAVESVIGEKKEKKQIAQQTVAKPQLQKSQAFQTGGGEQVTETKQADIGAVS